MTMTNKNDNNDNDDTYDDNEKYPNLHVDPCIRSW